MDRIYKYGFWFLIIVVLTLFNFLHITKTSLAKEVTKCEEINNKRITSLLISNNYSNRKIEKVIGENIITEEKENNLFSNKTIAILLSEFKCNKCQENELKRLDTLKVKLQEEDINLIGITTAGKKNEVAIQKKILKLNYPIFWIADTTFSKISVSNEYPQIIYINDNIIQSAFIAVPLDDKFSEIYYAQFLKNM